MLTSSTKGCLMNERLQVRLEGVVQSAREWSEAKSVLETLAANDWEAGDLPEAENRLHEQLVHDVLKFADHYRSWESGQDE
jgi:hypothetical protein